MVVFLITGHARCGRRFQFPAHHQQGSCARFWLLAVGRPLFHIWSAVFRDEPECLAVQIKGETVGHFINFAQDC